jgi:predicted aldo/keto reductase-like oxidoreductase
MSISAMDENKRPSACIGCRSCEAVCPQNIKISEVLSDFVKKLG